MRREEGKLLKLLSDDDTQRADDDGQRTDNVVSFSESESSCDEEIANAMQTSLETRFENILHSTSNLSTIFNRNIARGTTDPEIESAHLSNLLNDNIL